MHNSVFLNLHVTGDKDKNWISNDSVDIILKLLAVPLLYPIFILISILLEPEYWLSSLYTMLQMALHFTFLITIDWFTNC